MNSFEDDRLDYKARLRAMTPKERSEFRFRQCLWALGILWIIFSTGFTITGLRGELEGAWFCHAPYQAAPYEGVGF